MAIIEVKNVSKSFGEKVALSGISLDIPEGGIFGLLGPNGAGKTTLIRIINRITVPSGGVVYFNGRPITDEDVSKIGYLPEERGLYRKMKVGEQAMYLAQLKGMSAKDAALSLKEWFVKFGIEDWWGKKIEELSKGMAQKIQFITTVVHKPSLMILDEPFSGFDPVNAELIRNEILRLYTGAKIESRDGLFKVLSDVDNASRHTAVLSLEEGVASNDVLSAIIEGGSAVNSFKELIPRMNDIFIKLVTEGE